MSHRVRRYRVYPDDWERWERIVWFWGEWHSPTRLVCYQTRPFSQAIMCPEILLGHDIYFGCPEGSEFVSKYIKRSLATAGIGPVGAAPVDPVFCAAYPAVWEFLTLAKVDAKVTRKLGSLTVFCDGPWWKVFLNDRETAKSLCVTAATWADLLGVLEAQVVSDAPGWRDLPGLPGKGKRGR